MALLALLVLRPIEIHPESAAGAGLLLLLLALMEGPREGRRDLLAPLASPTAFLLPLFALNLAISCERHQSLLVLARWLLLGALGIALVRIVGAGGARRLAGLAALLGTAAGLVALWQGLYGLRHQAAAVALQEGPLREAILARLGSGRVFGTFILPASLGGALAITLPLTVALLLMKIPSRPLRSEPEAFPGSPAGFARPSREPSASPHVRLPQAPETTAPLQALPEAPPPHVPPGVASPSGIPSWALATGAAIQGAALVWTISLGAWIALIAGSVVVLGAAWGRDPRRRRLLAAGVVLGALLLAAGLAARTFLLPRPGIEDRPLFYRIGNWEAALRMFQDNPVTGTGLGTYGNVFPAYRTAGMNESRFAHSTWLQLLAELGIGAVPILLIVLAGAVRLLVGASAGPLQAAGAIGALAFLAQNVADFTAYQPSVAALFVLACALTLATPGLEARGERTGAGRRRIGWAACLATAGAAGLFLVASGLSDLERERAMTAHGIDPAEERTRLQRSMALDRIDPQPRGELSRLLSAAPPGSSDLARARDEGAIAVAMDPNTPFRRRDLALIDLKEGHPAAAWTGLVWASFLYPASEAYRSDLASIEARLFTKPPRDGAP